MPDSPVRSLALDERPSPRPLTWGALAAVCEATLRVLAELDRIVARCAAGAGIA